MRHLLTILTVSVSALMISRAIAPPARMYLALASSGLKLTCALVISIALLSALVILVLPIMEHFFLWCTTESGVWPLVTCCQRCATWQLVASTAHALGWPVPLCPIESPFIPFLIGEKEADEVFRGEGKWFGCGGWSGCSFGVELDT